jgi:EmrB/QacA subfamily drug resistance transporter
MPDVRPEPPAPALRNKWLALGAVSLGVATTILNATVSNVAIPAIAEDLGLSTTSATWVNAGYALTFASLLLLCGRVADRIGRRRMFVGGVLVFAAASVMIALSSSVWMIIGWRIIQGAAAATILPASLSLINAVFRGRDRAVAFAVWGSIIGGVSALGPLIGGFLIEGYGWEWAFLINVPIAALTITMALKYVPDSKGKQGEALDVVGAVLATAGVGLLVFGIIEGQSYGWFLTTDALVLGPAEWTFVLAPSFVALVSAAALLGSFVALERSRKRNGKPVLLDLSLFGVKSFRYGSLTGIIVSLGEFGLLFALPLFLQAVYGYDALETGVVLISLALGAFVASGMAAPISQRIGAVKTLRMGMVFEVVGIIGLGFALTPDGDGWQLVPWLAIYGIGVGFATSQLAGISLSQVPVEQSGSASGAQSTARQLGAAIGIAILGATLLAGLGSTTSALTERGVPQAQAEQVTAELRATAGTIVPSLADEPNGEVLVAGASEGFANAIQLTSWVAAAWVSVGLAATFLLPNVPIIPKRRPDDEGPEATIDNSDNADGAGNAGADADATDVDAPDADDVTATPVATAAR